MKIYSNHIGFEQSDRKTAVLEAERELQELKVYLCNEEGKRFPVRIGKCERIEEWSDHCYYSLDFSEITETGNYRLIAETGEEKTFTELFPITDYYLNMQMVNAARAYFKGERDSGEWLKADKTLSFDGPREGIRDLHGGWYDATGDFGIHLTQLSHTGVYNPMQSLLPSYVCFAIADRIEKERLRDCRILKKELLDEAYWGADLAMRLYCEGGSFLRSVDRGEAFSEKQHRKIDYEYFRFSGHEEDQSYLQETIENKNYETGLRSGGGLAVVVLAQAAGHGASSGEHMCREYLETAEKAFRYLMEKNELQISDGKWNFLDWYLGLLAATELYAVTGEEDYLQTCRYLEKGMERYLVEMKEGSWFLAEKEQLYFHPSDEGLPLIALMRYSQAEPDPERKKRALAMAEDAMRHVLSISRSPFGYAAFTWKKRIEDRKEENRFFFPHNTKAAPWWQGENARIASLAASALLLAKLTEEKGLKEILILFAQKQLDWIMGCNPFDSCMIDGYGRNNIRYFFKGQYDFMNSPGGICNGITARSSDDRGLEFVMEPTKDCDDNWRWAEQWIPHVAWYLYAEGLKLL